MIWALTGAAAFGFFVLFEYQKCRSLRRGRAGKNFWLLPGLLLLLLSCVMAGRKAGPAGGWRFWAGLAVLSAGLLFYGKVLGVADAAHYARDDQPRPVSREGLYGRMRHPGVWSFLLCAAGYGLMFSGVWRLALWLAFLNLIYTWLQDRFFFPVYLSGYEAYRREVPYLWPFKRPKNR